MKEDLSRLSRFFPNSSLLVLSKDPQFTRKNQKVKSIQSLVFSKPKTRLPQIQAAKNITILIFNALTLKYLERIVIPNQNNSVLKEIQEASFVVICGGGNLNSYSQDLILARLNIMLIAGILQKSTFMLSQTLGPFFNRFHSLLVKLALNKATLIVLRDSKESSIELKKLKITKPIVLFGIDDAFFLDYKAGIPKAKSLLLLKNCDKKLLVGVTLHRVKLSEKEYCSFKNTIAETLDLLITVFNAHIVFIPHLVSDLLEDDVKVSDDVVQCMKHGKSTSVIIDKSDPSFIKSMTSQMDLVISTRYHPLVFSESTGIASLGLIEDSYYSTKIRSLRDQTSGTIEVLPIKTLTFNLLAKTIHSILINNSSTKTRIKASTQGLSDGREAFDNKLYKIMSAKI